jgi:hypothetical protein
MPGRNDPCPCGSGKKYKKCCLLKEAQERADQRRGMLSPGGPAAVPEGWELESPPFAPDPLTNRINAWWEAFETAPYEEKWDLADAALRDEPELMDAEMIFEVGDMLFNQAMERDDFERFDRLLHSFKEKVPEAYEDELTYILNWRFNAAVVRQDWLVVKDVFVEFSQIAGRDLDIYHRWLTVLAYYGRLGLMVRGMREALPSVVAAGNLVDWAGDEFAEKLGTYEVLHRLQEDANLTADDPDLLRCLAAHELTVVPEQLEQSLDYRSGRVEPAWETSDFVLSPGDNAEDDPARERLAQLLMCWSRYASVEEGVPLAKVEMVGEDLYSYLVQRSEGELSDGPSPFGNGRKRQRKKRGKQQWAARPEAAVLVPDRKTVDRFLGQMVGFLSFRYYEACAFYELLPVWLRFLKRYGLIDEEAHSWALNDLKELHSSMVELAETALDDRQVVQNLRAWGRFDDDAKDRDSWAAPS